MAIYKDLDMAELVLKTLVVLNIYDAISTLLWIELNLARELNPFMALLIEINPILFVLIKTILVNTGVWLIWLNRESSLSKLATAPVFLLYFLVCIKHTIFGLQIMNQSFLVHNSTLSQQVHFLAAGH
jgi:hypothetical protein